ncbi:hypothetical protein ACGFNU_05660 [Spirillospora sp. NPDC048911]
MRQKTPELANERVFDLLQATELHDESAESAAESAAELFDGSEPQPAGRQ